MPRFDNEGFNPKKRIDNDSRDRSVPTDENYYGGVPIDLDFNNRQSSNDIVRDRQNEQYNSNQYNTYNDELEPPVRSSRQQGINPTDYGYSEEEEHYQGRDRSPSRERQRRQAPPVKHSKKPKKKIKGPEFCIIRWLFCYFNRNNCFYPCNNFADCNAAKRRIRQNKL